ncbi:Protein RecA [Streptomyces badius]
MLVRSGALDLIVIDSVAALVPRAEIEGEMGDSHVGLQARLMSRPTGTDNRLRQSEGRVGTGVGRGPTRARGRCAPSP